MDNLGVNNYGLQLKTLFEVDQSIAKNCLKILPQEPKRKLQKFVVGSQKHMEIWECKKGELNQVFKSESQSESDAQQISRVVLSISAPDKFNIFYSVGQSIRGITKKGKAFFSWDTNHADQISGLHVKETSLWSSSEYILQCYESSSGKIIDKYYYICDDKINDLIVAPVGGQMVLNPILACQDKQIRVLSDKGDSLLYNHEFEAACVSISMSSELSDRQSPILGYGLSNGGIGVIEFMRNKTQVMWSLEPAQIQGGNCAPVSLVKLCKLNKVYLQQNMNEEDMDSQFDLVVARDDGHIEIYTYVNRNPFPTLCYEKQIKSTITGIDAGHITMSTSQDVLLSCYDGKILALIDSKKFKKQGIMAKELESQIQEQVMTAVEEQTMNKGIEKEKKDKISSMEKEVADLERMVAKLEEETKEMEAKNREQSKQLGGVGMGANVNLGQEHFKVSYKLNLLPDEGAYMLIVDSKLPIASIIMQSKQNLDILEIKDNLAKIVKDLEIFDPNIQSLAHLVIDGDGQNNMHNRLEIKLRTSEGQQGAIQLLVLPKTKDPSNPENGCKSIEVALKPLNLHEKVYKLDPEIMDQLILNSISFSARGLDIEDSLFWLSTILPDVPSVVDTTKEDIQFTYQSSFVSTYLIISLKIGQISIKTDNYSVLTIMKDQIMMQANQRKMQLNIDSDFYDDSVLHVLAKLHPLVQEQYDIAKQNQLIDGLRELQINENDQDSDFLCDEYKQILANAEHVKQMFDEQPRKLAYLWGIIADLYVDTAKIKGFSNVQQKMAQLKQILNNYDYNDLVSFFRHLIAM